MPEEYTLLEYYSNYRGNFKGYLKTAWADRHLELDRSLVDINRKEDASILDLGCGTGTVALYLACKLGGKGKVLGIDINQERLLCARERLKLMQAEIKTALNCEFSSKNLFQLSPENKFDLIYMEETFHHLEPRLKAVRKIAATLKKNGILIISEVNALNFFMQALLIKRRGLKTIINKTDERGQVVLYGNERILPSSTLKWLFNQSGLKHVSTRYLRIFHSSFARNFDRYLELMSLERKLIKLNIFRYLFAIHYNMIFIKT